MNKHWWSGLQVKIIAWSFVPTVIILSAVAWFTFYSYQKVLGDLTLKQDSAIVRVKVDQTNQVLNKLLNDRLRPIVFNIDTNPNLSLEDRAQHIIDLGYAPEVFDGGVYFVDQSGKVFKSQPERPELIGQDWSDTPQFEYVSTHPPGAAPLTDYQTIGADQAGMACIVWPIIDPQQVFVGAGYYCFAVRQDGQGLIYNTLKDSTPDESFYLIDGNQRIVYSPDPAQQGRDLSGEDFIQQLFQSESKSIHYKTKADDQAITYSPLLSVRDGRNHWGLISEQSWSNVMQPSLPYRRLLYALLALGVVVPVLVTAYGVRHLTRPIQKLSQAAEQLTAGQFKHQIKVKTGDEIETLADQFNLMSARLDESYSSLEKKVTDRTRELAVMNAILSVANRTLNLPEILADALGITVEQMGFEAGAAYTMDPGSPSPSLVTRRGFEPASLNSLASHFANPAEPGRAEFAPAVTVYSGEDVLGLVEPSGYHQLVSVPLSSKGRTLGLFLLGKQAPGEPSPEELSLLASIGQQIGVAIENAHLYEQAEEAAITAERHRLARELHDAVTQTLFSANLIADVIPRIWKRDPTEGMRNLEELRQLTRGALAEMRTLLLEMRPESLERMDLKALLTQLADAFIGRVRVPVAVTFNGEVDLPQEVKLVFYRVAQEALNNIAKHSGARQVELCLEGQPSGISLDIRDDGLGFDLGALPPGHLGIAIMRERASSIGALFKIDSQVGQGTTIQLSWTPPPREGSHG